MSLSLLAIPPRSRRCCVEQEDFYPGGEYYSLLEMEGVEEYRRRDFCPACWSKEDFNPRKIFWRSRVPAKEHQPETVEQDKEALIFLRELLESGQEAQAFVLALFLARNRLLRLLKEVHELHLYEVVDTEEILCVKKVALSTIQVEEVRKALADKFKKDKKAGQRDLR